MQVARCVCGDQANEPQPHNMRSKQTGNALSGSTALYSEGHRKPKHDIDTSTPFYFGVDPQTFTLRYMLSKLELSSNEQTTHTKHSTVYRYLLNNADIFLL